MSTQVQYRRGTATENNAFTGALAEITVDTTNWTLRVHDGATAGGGGNIATVSYVTAQLAALSANAITFGTSNVQIPESNGNVRVNVGGTSNVAVFSTAGVAITGNITSGSANATANIGSATTYFNTVHAKATSAQYADVAEYYASDATYEPGTVVVFGGSNEITISTQNGDDRVAGVVSTKSCLYNECWTTMRTCCCCCIVGSRSHTSNWSRDKRKHDDQCRQRLCTSLCNTSSWHSYW
jgi:hypothetical protein